MLKIVHSIDQQLWVIDKPEGLSAHNTPPEDVVSQLETQFGQKFHLINRLDKETSGLMLASNNAEVTHSLMQNWNDPHTIKTYLAICRGVLQTESGQWNFPISDKAEGFQNPQGKKADQKSSSTSYQVLKSNKYFSLVKLQLHTGRQHQIRKHCAIAKHALINDSRYGDKKYNKKISSIYEINRMMLHCAEVQINWNGKTHHWQSEMPADFHKLFQEQK